MAVTASGFYVVNLIDVLDATQLAMDLTLTSNKIALLSNSATPNFSTDQNWSSTNEVSGTGWASGGIALSAAASGGGSVAPTLTESPTGSLKWDMADIAVAATTLTNAQAARFYADALTGDPLIALINFGGQYSTNNGIFGIVFDALGVAAIDVTP